MGFIKAFSGALSGTFADQWKDFYGPRQGVPATAAVFEAVPRGTNAGRGENYKGSNNIITNGSKIIVPEQMALITIQDGAITGLIAEPGGFIYNSSDPNSKSIFSGDGILASIIKESWDRFKFGGQPGTEQLAFYINLKEIAGNKFGTQSEIAFFDNFLGTQVSVVARGQYSIKIVDPILFVKQFVPMQYLQPGAQAFDLSDMDNVAGSKLFSEFVSCLGGALSKYTSDPEIQGSLIKVQSDQLGFARAMSQIVEENYQWKSVRGIEVSQISVDAIEYDDETKELLKEVRQDDREIRKASRMGQAYSSNMAGMMAAASAQAMNTAAGNENGVMMGFMGMNLAQQNSSNMVGAINNLQAAQNMQNGNPSNMEQMNSQVSQNGEQQPTPQMAQMDPYEELKKAKELLDAGIISQADFDAKKAKLLGI